MSFCPLILLTSGTEPVYQERRRAQRETWLPVWERLIFGARTDIAWPGWFHVMADPQLQAPWADCAKHELWLPVAGDYAHLPLRTREMLRWVLQTLAPTSFTHILKADDDTYIHPHRLSLYEPGDYDYIGAEWTHGCAYGSGGAGYLLSRKAAGLVVEHLTEPTGAEDMVVGFHLRRLGIPLQVERRFIPFSLDSENRPSARRPLPDNDLITGHHLGPQPLRDTHALNYPH